MNITTKIILWWNRLWIRKDEFHKSLDMDFKLMRKISSEEKDAYIIDLVQRRQKAHDKE